MSGASFDIIRCMTKTTLLVRLDPKTRKAMETVKQRDGVPYQQQVQRAIAAWLAKRGGK